MITDELTLSEKAIIPYLIHGNHRIASELNVELCTVKAHVHNILSKMQVATRTQALIKAIKMGIIKIEDIDLEDCQK